jgi:hypothetical protein
LIDQLYKQIQTKLPCSYQEDILKLAYEDFKTGTSNLNSFYFLLSLDSMSSSFLNSIAPKEKIKSCIWFTESHEEFSMSSRVKYAIQGGLPYSAFVNKTAYNLKLEELTSFIVNQLETLKSLTILSDSAFLKGTDATESKVELALNGLLKIIDIIYLNKNEVLKGLTEQIEETSLLQSISSYASSLDQSYKHHNLTNLQLKDYSAQEVNAKSVIIQFEGEGHFELHPLFEGPEHDIELLQIDDPVRFSGRIETLEDKPFNFSYYKVTDFYTAYVE